MDADRKHEILISETKEFITHCMADRMNFMFSSIHPTLKLKQGWQGVVQVDAEQAVGLHYIWRTPILRNPNPYTGLQVNFTVGGDITLIMLGREKNLFCAPGKKLFLYTKGVCYANIFEKKVQKKHCQLFCSQDMQTCKLSFDSGFINLECSGFVDTF